MMSTRGFFAALLLMATAAGSPAFAQLTRAQVTEGTLVGFLDGKAGAFLGVPFAAPPIGAGRWKPPRPAEKWQGDRKATRFAASCQQAVTPQGFGPWTAEYVVQGEVSEDCLYLNVWTPAKSAEQRLPVLVWIHGGGFSSGSGSVAIYNGAALAAKGIVVVNVNYRVGVYGFLAHAELAAESPVHASGNYGLLDQIAGLRWVRDNIAAFGGDPSQVTVAGQSAGAAAVHHLIASPLAKKLFVRAIAQSGSGMGLPVPELATAELLGKELGSLAELRALSAQELDARVAQLKGGGQPGRFGPVVDGLVLPNAKNVGAATNITPILTGMTANEMTGLNPGYGKTTVASFNAQLQSTYGKSAPDFLALYSAKTDAEAWELLDAQSRDRGLASMYVWARGRQAAAPAPIYAYLWTHPEPGPDAARHGAFHSSEIPYVFDTLDASKRPFVAKDRALAKELSAYWVNFVKSGDPNGAGLAPWPAFTADKKQIMELGERTQVREVLDARKLAVFERYVKDGGQLSLF